MYKEKISKLTSNADGLTMENEELREKMLEVNKNAGEMKMEVKNLDDLATFATMKHNERYSRKHSVEIYSLLC